MPERKSEILGSDLKSLILLLGTTCGVSDQENDYNSYNSLKLIVCAICRPTADQFSSEGGTLREAICHYARNKLIVDGDTERAELFARKK